jgi:hypothetical protein
VFLLALIVTLSLLPISVSAIPEYAIDMPLELKNFCVVCHTQASGGPLNVYGQDYFMHGNNVSAIALLDSDGDSFTNDEELIKGTFPGDSNSYPNAPTGINFNLIAIIVGIVLLVLFTIIWYLKR